jgi:hypothetical protein
VRQRMADHGQEIPSPDLLSPEALGAHQRAEIEKWWPVIKAAGIKGLLTALKLAPCAALALQVQSPRE